MSLAELSGDAPLPPERFLPVALAAARALDAVHRSSLHGDVRPDNLVWRGDAVELVGALHRGPARTDDVPHLSLPAESLPYLAPERTGRTAWMPDRRSDLYSLGV
ncbi:MAG TPA: hypothetical protein VKZ63_15500, partial [Kofleriaceae bacterium]|nr:hypothetical protein [Kofleriaceae bacterium]